MLAFFSYVEIFPESWGRSPHRLVAKLRTREHSTHLSAPRQDELGQGSIIQMMLMYNADEDLGYSVTSSPELTEHSAATPQGIHPAPRGIP